MAGEDHISRAGGDELAPRLLVRMNHGDRDVGALLLEGARGGLHGLDRRREFERCGVRDQRRRLQRRTDDADPDPAALQHQRVRVVGQHLAIGAAQIGGQHRKARLAHALQINLRPEVEFMVAGREDVGRQLIEQRDHMGALVEA